MDDEQLRGLVREAIARHLGGALPPAAIEPAVSGPVAAPFEPVAAARFHIVRPANEVECVIEPSVTCNHCGHCLCYGH